LDFHRVAVTVSSTTNRVSYSGNGSTTAFAFSHPFRLTADLVVTVRTTATGAESLKVEGSDYTVSGTADSGTGGYSSGTVTFSVAPASGTQVHIDRVVTRTQTSDFISGDGIPPASIEGALDKLSLSVQELDARFARTLLQPRTAANRDLILPEPASAAVGKLLSINTAGTAYELVTAANVGLQTVRERLTANRTYYVRTDGSDSNDGLANTAGRAFLTLQAAVNAYLALDLNGFAVTISVADGIYTSGASIVGQPVGGSSTSPLTIQGNTSTPGNCIISTTSANCIKADNGARVVVNGLELRTTTSGRGLLSTNGSYIVWGTAMNFGACATYHMEATNLGILISLGGYTINGGSVAHQHCTTGGYILVQSGTVTITGTPAFSAYFIGVNGAYVQYASTVTFSGSATGPRYLCHNNATIYTGNVFSPTFFPGSTAGVIKGGGIVDNVSGSFEVQAASAVAASLTGTVNETVLATVTIPAGVLGANGIIRIYSNWSNNNNANNKTCRIRLNGLGTQAILGTTNTTSIGLADLRYVQNVNSFSSQKAWQFSSTGGLGQTSGAVTTAAIDTTASISLVFTGQLANSADSMALENYVVETCYRP